MSPRRLPLATSPYRAQAPTPRRQRAPTSPTLKRWLLALGTAAFACAPSAQPATAAGGTAPGAPASWPVVGRQGMVLQVVVPLAQAAQREAYAQQISQLCRPETSCFINFYSNSTGAAVSVPLPDAVSNEPTAIFRRSTKQGADLFRWSCRMQQSEPGCF
jgi:hypothetical protein